MYRDGYVLRLKGVHVEASTSDQCSIDIFQLILRVRAGLDLGGLANWMHPNQIA